MDAYVRGFVKSAWVRINGDINANEKAKKLAKEIASKKKELKRIQDSMLDGKATESEIESVNKLILKVKKLEDDKNNSLVITLLHPGEDGNITVTKPLSLGNGQNQGSKFPATNYIKDGLFKKRVIGEFGIKVSITDKDKASKFGLFVRKVLAGVIGGAFKKQIDDISNVLTSNTASVLSADTQAALKAEKEDKIDVVATSETAVFRVNQHGKLVLTNSSTAGISFANDELKFDLKTPGLLKKTKNSYLLADKDNGKVCLKLLSEPV